jgi:hypothetical protein
MCKIHYALYHKCGHRRLCFNICTLAWNADHRDVFDLQNKSSFCPQVHHNFLDPWRCQQFEEFNAFCPECFADKVRCEAREPLNQTALWLISARDEKIQALQDEILQLYKDLPKLHEKYSEFIEKYEARWKRENDLINENKVERPPQFKDLIELSNYLETSIPRKILKHVYGLPEPGEPTPGAPASLPPTIGPLGNPLPDGFTDKNTGLTIVNGEWKTPTELARLAAQRTNNNYSNNNGGWKTNNWNNGGNYQRQQNNGNGGNNGRNSKKRRK